MTRIVSIRSGSLVSLDRAAAIAASHLRAEARPSTDDSTGGSWWPAQRAPWRQPLTGWLVVVLVCGLWLSAPAEVLAAGANESSGPRVELGWNQQLILGRWSPVRLHLPAAEAGRYRLEVVATDPTGDLVTYMGEAVDLEAGSRTLDGIVRAGRVDDPLDVILKRDETTIWQRQFVSRGADRQFELVPQSQPLMLAVGVPTDFTAGEIDVFGSTDSRRFVRWPDAATLPTDVRAYDGVTHLLVVGSRPVPDVQSATIEQWVRRGGRLILSLNADTQAYQASSMSRWVPIQIGPEPSTVRELGGLQSYANKNVRVPIVQRLQVPTLIPGDAVSLSTGRDPQVLLRTPLGLGLVTVLALDVTQAPLKNWSGLGPLIDQLTDSAGSANDQAAQRPGRQQLSSSGVTDMATQLASAQDSIPGVSRLTPWPALGLVLLFVILIGPVDYLLTHHVLKNAAHTWWTMPLMVCGAIGLTALVSSMTQRTTIASTRLELIDLDAATNTLRGSGWLTVYGPRTSRLDVRLKPEDWRDGRVDPSSISLSWSGTPEPSTGGMYRRAGIELQQGDYRWGPSPGRISQAPVQQGSTRALSYDWSGTVTGLVESDLSTPGIGRLQGSVTHHLSAPIDDWFLAWGTRVFRRLESADAVHSLPFEPDTQFRLDQRDVFQREFRGFLTQSYVRREKSLEKKSENVLVEQSRYNPLSVEPDDFMPVLAFFRAAGGAGYTTLNNASLDRLDTSQLLTLNRAVLFGRLRSQPAGIELNGAELVSDRHDVYVRVVLPVRKDHTELKPLPSLSP